MYNDEVGDVVVEDDDDDDVPVQQLGWNCNTMITKDNNRTSDDTRTL